MTGSRAVIALANEVARRFGLDLRPRGHERLVEALGPEPEQAAAAMLGDAAAIEALATRVTNGETYLLRHGAHFEALAAFATERFAERPEAGLRVWSAGCASGEEAVSAAMVLRDLLPETSFATVSVLGTDLSEASLSKAREGRYGPWSFRGVPPDVRSRHFVRDGEHFRPVPGVRRALAFRRHNLLAGPPSGETFEVVLCRNVLLHFDPDAIERAFAVLAQAVTPGGLLLLGPAESAARTVEGFALVDMAGALVHRRLGAPVSSDPPPKKAKPAARREDAPRTTAATRRLPRLPPTTTATPRPAPPSEDAAPPGSYAARLARARSLADRGRLDEAARLAQGLAALAPDDPEVHLLRAVVALEAGHEGQAADALEAVLAAEPEQPVAHYLRGLLLQGAGHLEGARAAYRRALSAMADLDQAAPLQGGGGLTPAELSLTLDASLSGLRRQTARR